MPARLGRYVVRRRIGSGAFATVWLAYDEHLDSPVAVKVLADNWSEDPQVRQRFVEEGRFLRKVESPYVVSVYDAGELDDGRPYLVMSYADQGTLAERLGDDGLTLAQSLEIVRQVGAGLSALHERGVLHRDVKPANVLLRTVEEHGVTSVRAMVADLGLGKALDMSSRLTLIAGTPTYAAPEQARGEPLDARADEYALAALSYLLIAGRAPYAHAALSAAAAPGPPPPLSTPERPVPAEVEEVLLRGLSVDREDRWSDVAGFVEALTGALGPETADATVRLLPVEPPDARARPAPRRGRVLVGALVAIAVVAGLGVGGYLLGHRTDAEVRLHDRTGSIYAVVPSAWERAVAIRGWRPANAKGQEFPALSIGTAVNWAEDGADAEGVFVGILPGTRLPEQMPQHPECRDTLQAVDGTFDEDASRTVAHTGCPGGLIIERVIRLASNRLLWVQVRSRDRATANAVLDDISTSGY